MTQNNSKSNVNSDNDRQTGTSKADHTVASVDLEVGFSKEEYAKARLEAIKVADRVGGRTDINYACLQNGLILKGTSKIKKSDLLKPKIEDVFETAIGFQFTVAAYGPMVMGIELYDVVDIKSSSGLSLRPFIPHKNNIAIWRERLKNDREAKLAYDLKSAEDVSKVGLVTVKNDKLDISPSGSTKFDFDEIVTVVEYFATEDHNVSGIIASIDIV